MRQDLVPTMGSEDSLVQRVATYGVTFPKHIVIGVILLVALFAFEMFNFDTTRYALANLLGPISFAGLGWATILAIAFCAIDFAGLVRMFSPEADGEQPKEVWYLMGAWLMGATMNALMTWWAVSLTLLNHDFGNEVLSREQLLQVVPIFVAVLVWLTRILFIGALSVAGEQLLDIGKSAAEEVHPSSQRPHLQRRPLREPRPATVSTAAARPRTRIEPQPHLAVRESNSDQIPDFLSTRQHSRQQQPAPSPEVAPALNQPGLRRVVEEVEEQPEPIINSRPNGKAKPNGRVRQRPPMPGTGAAGLSASPRKRN